MNPPNSGFLVSSVFFASVFGSALNVIVFAGSGAAGAAPNVNIAAGFSVVTSFFSSGAFTVNDAVVVVLGDGALKENVGTSAGASVASGSFCMPNEKVAVGFGLSTSSTTFTSSTSFGAVAAAIPNENFTSDGAGSGTDADDFTLLLKEKYGAASLVPGFDCSQQTHFDLLASLRVMQAVHSQFAACFSAIFLNVSSVFVAAGIPKENCVDGMLKLCAFGLLLLPGFGVSQAMQASLSTSFLVIHASHSHEVVFCFAARLLNKSSLVVAAGIPKEKLGAAGAAGLLPGLGVSQQAHLSLLASFFVMQASHSHCVAFCWAARVLKRSSDGGPRDCELILLSTFGTFVPGFEVSQHKHFVFSESLRVRQESHSHDADFCLATRLANKLSVDFIGDFAKTVRVRNEKLVESF